MQNISTSRMGAASSRMESGRQGRLAVMDVDSVMWATALPLGTSAQQAELKALTQALKLAKGAIANVYRQQMGLLTAEGKTHQE